MADDGQKRKDIIYVGLLLQMVRRAESSDSIPTSSRYAYVGRFTHTQRNPEGVRLMQQLYKDTIRELVKLLDVDFKDYGAEIHQLREQYAPRQRR
jgi:hypothetical protein